MLPARTIPTNMDEICRLCLSSEGSILPIFGEEESRELHIPLSFRILACVSVEVTDSDGLPSLICQQCLDQVDSWTDFKQQCDASQATLKEWQRAAAAAAVLDSSTAVTADGATITCTNPEARHKSHPLLEKQQQIKQEPPDSDDDVMMEEDGEEEEEEEEPEDGDESMTELVDDAESVSSTYNDRRLYSHMPVEIKQEEIQVSDECTDNEYDITSPTADGSNQFDGNSKLMGAEQRSSEASSHHLQSHRPARRPRRLLVARKRRFLVNSSSSSYFSCLECNRGFGSKSHARRHELAVGHVTQASQTDGSHVCQMCNKAFSNRSNMDRHLRLHKGHKLQAARGSGNSTQNGPSWHNQQQKTEHTPKTEPETDEEFFCYVCGKIFNSHYRLKFHMGQHTNYKCPKCNKNFKGGTALSNHLRTHNIRGFTRHTCRFCLRSFATLAAMMSHRKTHYRAASAAVHNAQQPNLSSGSQARSTLPATRTATASLPPTPTKTPGPQSSTSEADATRNSGLMCRICSKWLNSFTLLEQHLMTHSTQKPYTCSICGLMLGYASSVHKHVRKMHGIAIDYNTIRQQLLGPGPQAGPPAPIINYPFCGKSPPKPPEPPPPPQPTQPTPPPAQQQAGLLPCTHCSRTFTHKSFLASHVRATHMGINGTHQCQLCGNAFAHRYLLLRHIKTHGGHTCTVCMKQFADLKTLNNHKGVHKRFKPYQCPTCSQCFNGLQRLQAHKAQAHPTATSNSTSSHPFACETCGESFATRAELAEHRESHISLKLYTCQICKNSYNSSSALSKHKRKHGHYDSTENVEDSSDNKPLVCEDCGKVFSDPHIFSQHLIAHARRKNSTELNNTASSSADTSLPEESHCGICNRTFRDHLSLIRHKGWHTRRPDRINVTGESSVAEQITPPSALPAIPPAAVTPPSTNGRTYSCDFCHKVYSNAGSLSKHRRTNCPRLLVSSTDQESFSQDDTDEDIKPVLQPLVVLEEGVEGEEASITSNNEHTTSPVPPSFVGGYPCALCPKVFRSAKALVVHRGWHARSPRPSPPQLPIVDSTASTRDERNRRSYTLMDASQTDDENRLYRCDACRRTFSNTSAFMRHKCLAQDDIGIAQSISYKSEHRRSGGVSCPICQRQCSREKYLLQHMKIHTEVSNPPQVSNLQQVSTSPQGSKPGNESGVTCTVCNRHFKKENYLTQHMRVHTGERPYTCSECGQSFSRQSILWKHKKKSHRPPFRCSHCPQEFPESQLLQKHLAEDHEQANGDEGEETDGITQNGDLSAATSECSTDLEID